MERIWVRLILNIEINRIIFLYKVISVLIGLPFEYILIKIIFRSDSMSRYIIGITGASGSIYAPPLIETLLKDKKNQVHLVVTESGRQVFEYELDYTIDDLVTRCQDQYGQIIKFHDINNYFAPIASGSFHAKGMVILPCSMGTLANISLGSSRNLLERAADVCLKEERKLILVPRETPLNSIHLENMLKLSRRGTTILPAMPGFYHHPESIEDLVNFVVGRVLNSLGIENGLAREWEGG